MGDNPRGMRDNPRGTRDNPRGMLGEHEKSL